MISTIGSSYSEFQLRFSSETGGITSLKHANDAYDTDYVMQGATLGETVVRYRLGQGEWQQVGTLSSMDNRIVNHDLGESEESVTFSYATDAGDPEGIRDFGLTERFLASDEGLVWTLRFHNKTSEPLELGDIALALLFNTQYVKDTTTTYTQRLIKHSLIAGHGSFIYWMRANGVGPYLVMTPLPGTKLEYFETGDSEGIHAWEGPYRVYVHSAVNGTGETRGTWRQSHTSFSLAPQGNPGDEITYGFKFRWADDYDAVREVLYEEGLFDVHVTPGMTVPQDLSVLFSLRTRNAITSIVPEHPDETRIEYLGEKQDTHVYKVHFSCLGENLLTAHYGAGQYLVLEFFVTESLETLIKKRAAFLVHNQQHRDPTKWYDGLISQWDMRQGVLRGPDDPDGFVGWWGYVIACDDTALPKAPFIAAKNLHFPVQEEIDAIEYYVERFVWGKLQRTDAEHPYPYGIYGVPNWYENRNSEHGFGSGGKGLEHLWRTFDYPHVMMLYFHLYQIAEKYSGMTHYLDKDGYLERAFGTAQAYFRVQSEIGYPEGWSHWAYELGCYNELLIVNLLEALYAEGWVEKADWLTGEWEKKVKYFVYDHPYPFGSEMYFDSTAFESTHAIAKYGLSHTLEPDGNLWYDKDLGRWYSHPQIRREDFETFMERQIQANIACRGWLETAYYYLGSDYRQVGSSRYVLSYMAQMGGWAILDYALYHAQHPTPYLRLGYNSYLSSWALMNTGTPASGYGYWYPGEHNDGASGWALKPEKYGPTWLRDGVTRKARLQGRGAWYYDGEIDLGFSGALRTAATIVTDDPLFGLVALGGLLTETECGVQVIPRDGLRKRFHLLRGERRLHVLLDGDGFAAEEPVFVRDGLCEICFTLENRTGDTHSTLLRLAGLPVGGYRVQVEGRSLGAFTVKSPQQWISVELPMSEIPTEEVSINRVSPTA